MFVRLRARERMRIHRSIHVYIYMYVRTDAYDGTGPLYSSVDEHCQNGYQMVD